MADKFTMDGREILVSVPSRFENFLGRGVSYNKYHKLVKETNRALAGESGVKAAVKHSGIKSKKIKVKEKNLPREMGGFCENDGKTIIINKNMPEGEKFWTITHELEHIKKKDPQKAVKLGRFNDPIGSLTFNETRREIATTRRVKQFLKKRALAKAAKKQAKIRKKQPGKTRGNKK